MAASAAPVIAFDARYVNDRYHGIGRHAYHLLEALTRLDDARRYLVFYHPGSPNTRFDLNALAKRPNVEVRPTGLRPYRPIEQVAWPFVLKRSQAALFHSPYVALPLLATTKQVMTVHDLILERFPEYRPRSWLAPFYPMVTKASITRAAAVLTVSQATAQDLVNYYRPARERVHVIGNAVAPTFRPQRNLVLLNAVRERYNLPPRFLLTLGAGRLHKGLDVLIDAFAQLPTWISAALVIAGDVDARFPDIVRQRVELHGLSSRVIRPGRIEERDLATLYSLAEVFVFPSNVEGFGLPALEAMACGTPVIAARTAAILEAVGDSAISFEPGNAGQLATQMLTVLNDRRKRDELRSQGLERARTMSWERVAQETLSVYRLLLSGQHELQDTATPMC